jgi:hypothetical protein
MSLEFSGALLDGVVAVGFWTILLLVLVGAVVVIAVRLARDLATSLRSKERARREQTCHWPDLPD